MTSRTPPYTVAPSGELRVDGPAAQILESLGAAVLVADRNQTIRYRNATAVSWLPDAPELETAFAAARFLNDWDGWSAALSRVLDAGEALRLECVLQPSDSSSPLLATLRCMPLRGHGSQDPSDLVIVIEEGAEQAALEERLEVSKRLASLGKLAARVAHELNNPLDGILRYVNLAIRTTDATPDSKITSYLTESRTGLMRMVQIIGDLLEFSRTTDGEFEEMTINEVVEQAIRSTASATDAAGVVVAADFQTQDMPTIRGSRLYQVCCNLIKNAVDAMPDGGRLSITTGVVGDDVIIRVTDTGIGLPEPIERVFEPFFTTKEPGKGTGLGLAICRDFIEEMQGTIDAAPGPDGGAVFTVRIPVSNCHRASPLMTPAPNRATGDSV